MICGVLTVSFRAAIDDGGGRSPCNSQIPSTASMGSGLSDRIPPGEAGPVVEEVADDALFALSFTRLRIRRVSSWTLLDKWSGGYTL